MSIIVWQSFYGHEYKSHNVSMDMVHVLHDMVKRSIEIVNVSRDMIHVSLHMMNVSHGMIHVPQTWWIRHIQGKFPVRYLWTWYKTPTYMIQISMSMCNVAQRCLVRLSPCPERMTMSWEFLGGLLSCTGMLSQCPDGDCTMLCWTFTMSWETFTMPHYTCKLSRVTCIMTRESFAISTSWNSIVLNSYIAESVYI
jgi:hypothetical protein